jgi:mannosyltransferase OCH1-like enzyme
MIPRKLHRIWFGQRPRPQRYDAYWEDWKSLHPDWTLITWTERNLPPLINGKLVERVKTTARSSGIPMAHDRAVAVQQADIVAYEIVWRYGGVYVNCDMQPLRSLESLLGLGAFAGYEDERYVCNAVMGGEPSHPFFCRTVEGLPRWFDSHIGQGMEAETGPRYMTHVYEGCRDSLTVLAQKYFYFAHHGSLQLGEDASAFEDSARASGAYALHHWGHRTQEGELKK